MGGTGASPVRRTAVEAVGGTGALACASSHGLARSAGFQPATYRRHPACNVAQASSLQRGHIELYHAAIRALCAKWQVTEFSIFGSAIRDDFHPDSDVDVLVIFAPEAEWSLLRLTRTRMERR